MQRGGKQEQQIVPVPKVDLIVN